MSRLSPASLRPLRHRDFSLVWSAALVSNIGSWMQTVAVGVLVTHLTHQAGWTGLVAAAAFLPIGLLSPVGGAVADRVDRRRWLLGTTMGETFFATVLAVLAATGNATPLAVTLAVLGGGTMAALGFPAYQAILPDLVPRDDLLLTFTTNHGDAKSPRKLHLWGASQHLSTTDLIGILGRGTAFYPGHFRGVLRRRHDRCGDCHQEGSRRGRLDWPVVLPPARRRLR